MPVNGQPRRCHKWQSLSLKYPSSAAISARSSVWKLETPGLTKCPKCGAYRLPHRLCKSCMTYNGREFGKIETTESKAN